MKIFVFAFLFTISLSGQAQITSTFDGDADGWTFTSVSTSIPVNHQSSGGNPNGYVSATYSSNASATVQNWIAPAKFRGSHLVRSLGMKLKFDLQQSMAGTGAGYDVLIRNGSNFIYLSGISPKPAVAPAWTSYEFTLDETGGWYYSAGATIATRSQIKGILTNVTSIEIRGTYGTNASYTSGLDNVVLEQRILSVAPSITSFSPTAAEPGTTITIDGNNFGTSPANNVVYFGSVMATVNSASAVQLSVVVPLGTAYGPITIINKTTGLISRSAKSFNPTFAKGGRIIPASFAPRVDIPLDAAVGNDVNGLALADMDGDGWNDIIVAENALNDVSVFRNLAQGGALTTSSFDAKISLDGGGNAGGLHITDLDGDGKLDIVSSNEAASNSRFATFRNISTPGNLVFEPVEIWSGLTYSGFASRVIDIDGDGRAELLGQHGSSSVFIDFWIAQNISTPGNVDFGNSVDFTFGNSIDAGAGVGAGDLDNDGKPELLVSDAFGSRFHILKNNSTPGTISLTQVGIINTGQYNNSLHVVDFNLDGKNDMAWRMTGGSIRIRLNNNTGGALSIDDFPSEIVLTGELGAGGGMTIHDINGDGKPDIVSSDNVDIGVYENNYSGGVFDAIAFVPAYQVSGSGSSATTGLACDLNNDTKPDLIFGATPTRISIFENINIHAPTIAVNTVSPLKGEIGSTVTITGNDFSTTLTGNKVRIGGVEATVLTASATELTVSVPAGAGYGFVSVTKAGLTSRYRLPFNTTFGPGVNFDNTHFAPPVSYTLTSANYDIEVGDLNLDGKPDVLAEANGGFVFRNTHTTGAISATSLTPDDTLSVNSFINPRFEDFDGDGLLDVLSVNGLLHKNMSNSSEISHMPAVTVGLGASTLDMSDFNNDGKLDVAITTDLSGAGDLVILENRSITSSNNFVTGTYGIFSSNIIFNKPAASGGVVTEDFDGDGFADIATTNPGSDNISLFRNLGVLKISTAQFATRLDVAVGDNPGRIYKGDFDSDGKIDMLLYHGTGTNAALLTVMHNTSTVGNISFNRIDLTNPSNTTVATIADLDGDGKPEIITTSETGNRFSIFKNIHTSGALTAASFAAPFNVTVTAPRGITTGDLNLDGKPEIIITRAASLLVVYENLISTGPSISITTQAISTNACEGTTATFTVDATGATNLTYQWQKYDGVLFTDLSNGGGFSGANTNTLSINTATTGLSASGQYRARINGDLADEVFSTPAVLTVNVLPTPPGATGGSECTSPAVVTLIATGTTDGNYNWYDVVTGGAVLGTNGSFNTPSITSNTTYYVSLEDAFCESTRVPVIATIDLLDKPSITFDPPVFGGTQNLVICEGDVQTCSAPAGFAVYTWSNGEVTQAIDLNQSGAYSVIVEDAAGCLSPPSDPVNVTINPYPTATITVNDTELSASSGSFYQWYRNDVLIAGATDQSFNYNLLEYGEYTVAVTTNGCTDMSEKFIYLITDEEINDRAWSVYPNPFTNTLTIETASAQNYEAELVDMLGRSITKFTFTQNKSLSTGYLTQGAYVLVIRNDHGTRRHILIKSD